MPASAQRDRRAAAQNRRTKAKPVRVTLAIYRPVARTAHRSAHPHATKRRTAHTQAPAYPQQAQEQVLRSMLRHIAGNTSRWLD